MIEQKDGNTTEMKLGNPFLEALKNDSLITAAGFSVQLKNDSLIINDVLQSKEVLNKYRSLLNGKTNLDVKVNVEKTN